MKELYLVTGATGHLGNTVAHRLARAGGQVRALVLPGEEHAPQLPEGVEAVAGDVRSRPRWRRCSRARRGGT